MRVNPDDARMLLGTSKGNRPVRQWHVRALASAIKRGEWILTHQGLAFDSDGSLRDGHHRLNAIIAADTGVPLMVTVGLNPEAMAAIDQGVTRTMGDLLEMDRRIAEVIKLAARIATSEPRPTPPQCQDVADTGLAATVERVLGATGTARIFFSSAPMRLAAAVQIMRGLDPLFVLGQYAALINLDFDVMTSASRSLMRQVQTGLAQASDTYATLARGLAVFDPSKQALQRVTVTEETRDAALALVRHALGSPVNGGSSTKARKRGKLEVLFEGRPLGA
jgi:hypothetical protein